MQNNKSTANRLGASQGLAHYYNAMGNQFLKLDFKEITILNPENESIRESVFFFIIFHFY